MASRSRSLRLKLALWFVVVFFVIQTALVGGLVVFRRERILRSLDDDLATSAQKMVDSLLNAQVEWTLDELRALVPKDARFVLFAVRDPDGETLVSWNVRDSEALPLSAYELVPAGPVGPVFTPVTAERTQRLIGLDEKLRLVTLPFRAPDGLYFFQAAAHDDTLARLLGPFTDLVVLGVPIGVLAATVAAWIIAGRAVAPILRLSKAVSAVSPNSLGERFRIFTTDEEIAGLEGEFNAALARLDAAYRAQDQFLSNVSHELKTPIAVLLTQAQVAKLGARSLERGYAFVDMTEEVMQRLGRVVESLLTLARTDLSEARPTTPVAVNDVLLGCLQACNAAAEQKRVRLVPQLLDLESEALVHGDAALLQTMVENLVNNAVRYSPEGAAVSIDAEVEGADPRGANAGYPDADAGVLRITVRDAGPGIPAEQLERVFERFVQLHPGQGTGLGLAIANAIAHLHGGSITATNNPGGGCSFAITLPLAEDAEPAPSLETPLRSRGAAAGSTPGANGSAPPGA